MILWLLDAFVGGVANPPNSKSCIHKCNEVQARLMYVYGFGLHVAIA